MKCTNVFRPWIRDSFFLFCKSAISLVVVSILLVGQSGCGTQKPSMQANPRIILARATSVAPAPSPREDPRNARADLATNDVKIIDLSDFLPQERLVGNILIVMKGSYATHINDSGQVGGYYSLDYFNTKSNSTADTQQAFLYTPGKPVELPIGMKRCGDIGDGSLMAGDNELANGAILYEHGVARKVMEEYRSVEVHTMVYGKDGIETLFGDYGEGATDFLHTGRRVGFQYDVKSGHLDKFYTQDSVETSCPCMNLNSQNLYVAVNATFSTQTGRNPILIGRATHAALISLALTAKSEPKNEILMPLPGTANCHITCVNSTGQSAGFCDSDSLSGITPPNACLAFFCNHGETIPLKSLGGGYTVPKAINNAGDIVGVSTTASGARHAFLYRNGKMTDLNDSVKGTGWTLNDATGINEHGQICGTGSHKASHSSAFLLTFKDLP